MAHTACGHPSRLFLSVHMVCSAYLLQLLLGILLSAQLILRTLPQLSQPVRLLLGNADLVLELLLQMHLLHFHSAMLLLSLLQPNAHTHMDPLVPLGVPGFTKQLLRDELHTRDNTLSPALV